MKVITGALPIVLGAVIGLGAGTPAHAVTQGACVAGKNKCMAKKASDLLKCEQKSETPGKKPIEPARSECRAKAMSKFDGAGIASKSCFGKLEAKKNTDCLTFADVTAAEQLVDDCVARIVQGIDPGAIDRSKCGAGKKQCAAKKLQGVLGCYEKQQKSGKPVDVGALDGCIAKARATFDGGETPEKGCFAKLEAKAKKDCLEPIGNGAATEVAVDACVNSILRLLEATPTTTSTSSTATSTITTTTSTTSTTSTTTTTMPVPSGCAGGSPNGVVDAGEECDDSDPAAPPGCNRCVLCGNGMTTAPQEQCDDGSLTNGDGCSATCQNEVCGDGIVTGNESCDDGNTVDFIPGDAQSSRDNCPANCIIEACLPVPGSSQLVTVSFDSPSAVAGILVAVDYPEGKVSIPGSGPVSGSISGLPSSVTANSNDKDYALIESVTKSTPFTTIPKGQLFKINFETCSGALAVTAGDFRCVVLDASDQFGTEVTATCSVTVP